jgi:hypothetical protein
MLEPITSLAFTVSSGKGVYALLLGSGLSRAAKIPTGWEITLDLIRQVAAGENAEDNPEAWYWERFKEEPDYSRLLDSLGKTPADRNNLLSRYFEPSADEIARGEKLPTPAHKAIARLVSKGYFRVIITTNFDRLLEQALESAGISPTVISSLDVLKGALPLTHARCTVIKVNGDYRDTRIKNTVSELKGYEPELDSLLDRVLDEYGLIVCGWSAAWDTALRNAILRSPNHRFSTYWTAKGEIADEAKTLISHRQGILMTIDSADQFFAELEAKLDALERYAQPHPLSAELAVVSLKKYIAEDKYRIELHDLLMREVDARVKAFEKLSFSGPTLTFQDIFERMKIYETGMEILIRLTINGAYWSQPEHHDLWSEIVRRLLTLCPQTGSLTHLLSLRLYPACLAFYAAGIAAIASGNYELLKDFLNTKVRVLGKDEPLALAVSPWEVLEVAMARELPGYERHYTPIHDRIFDVLRAPVRDFLVSDSDYDLAFDRFEYMHSLVHVDISERSESGLSGGTPWGRFAWKRDERINVIQQILAELKKESANWRPIKAGLFASQDRFLELQQTFRDEVWKHLNFH